MRAPRTILGRTTATSEENKMITREDLLRGTPPTVALTPADVRRARGHQSRQLVVLG